MLNYFLSLRSVNNIDEKSSLVPLSPQYLSINQLINQSIYQSIKLNFLTVTVRTTYHGVLLQVTFFEIVYIFHFVSFLLGLYWSSARPSTGHGTRSVVRRRDFQGSSVHSHPKGVHIRTGGQRPRT